LAERNNPFNKASKLGYLAYWSAQDVQKD